MKYLFILLMMALTFTINAQALDKQTKESLEIVSSFYKLIDTKKIEEWRELFADNCEVFFASAKTPTFIDDVIPFVKEHYKAFPDYTHHVDQMIASGDFVTVRVRYTGTHMDSFFENEATYRRICYSGIFIFEVKNQLITRVWGIEDDLGLQQQLKIGQKTEAATVFSCEKELVSPSKK